MKAYLFINGVSEVGIDEVNNKYYVDLQLIDKNSIYDCFVEVTKEQFKSVLTNQLKWVKESWDKELVEEYNMLLKKVSVN